MTITATITVDAPDTETARRLIEAAGFKSVRFASLKASPTTPRSDGVRASAVLDRPTDLDPDERKAYARGYARSCMAYVKKNGPASMQGPVDLARLTRLTQDHEWDRHPAAHKAGVAELKKHREFTATYEAERRSRQVAA